MSSNGLYMPLYVEDYLTDADHLSTLEHGAYLLLIMNYWKRSEPLPADDRKLARIARMTADEWSAARDMVLEFFEERDGHLHHGRIDSELKKAKEKSAKARESASARHATDKRAPRGRDANAKRPQSEGNALKDKDKEEDASASSARAPATPLAELKTGIVRAFQSACSMTTNPDTHRASVWLSQGYDPALCLAVIAEVLGRKPHVGNLSYFDQPIREAHEKRAPAPASAGPPVPLVEMIQIGNGNHVPVDALREAIAAWSHDPATWWGANRDRYGMPPRHPACGIPREFWPAKQQEVAA